MLAVIVVKCTLEWVSIHDFGYVKLHCHDTIGKLGVEEINEPTELNRS